MLSIGEFISELGSEGEVHGQLGDSGIHFPAYESNSDRGGDILVTLEDPSCVVLTRSQRPFKYTSTPTSPETLTKSKEIMNQNYENGSKVQEVQMFKCSKSDTSFDIMEFCKSSRIQISPAKYLKLNPKELEKLINYVQERNSQLKPSSLPLINLESSQ